MQTHYVLSHEWLAWYSHRACDIGRVDVAAGQRLQSGTVLGRVTATGRLVKHDEAATNGAQTPVAFLGSPMMDGVAGTFPALVYAGEVVVFPGALNGGAGISPTTAAQLRAMGVRLEGPITAGLPGAGAGVGEITLDAPPVTVETFRILARNGDVITTRSGDAITWR